VAPALSSLPPRELGPRFKTREIASPKTRRHEAMKFVLILLAVLVVQFMICKGAGL
jgi:hypothetical protein